MTEIEFCEHWCGKLESLQYQMTEYHIEKGTFMGVGREIGRMVFWPMVRVGKGLSVLDGAGHYRTVSIEGRRAYGAEGE